MAERREVGRLASPRQEGDPTVPVDPRIRLLAREIYHELRRNGRSPQQIVIIIEQLISQAADEMQRERDG